MSAYPDGLGPARFLIAVKEGHPPEAVASDLRKMGISVDRVLSTTGVIGGSGPSSLRAAISKLPGVELVQDEHFLELPPFSDKVAQ